MARCSKILLQASQGVLVYFLPHSSTLIHSHLLGKYSYLPLNAAVDDKLTGSIWLSWSPDCGYLTRQALTLAFMFCCPLSVSRTVSLTCNYQGSM